MDENTTHPILFEATDLVDIVLIVDDENNIVGQNDAKFFNDINNKKITDVFSKQEDAFGEAMAEAKKDGQSTNKKVYLEINRQIFLFNLKISRCKTADKLLFFVYLSPELKHQNEFLLKIIEQSRECIVLFDQKGKIIFYNKRTALLSGYSFEDVSNIQIWNFAEIIGFKGFGDSKSLDYEDFKNKIIDFKPGSVFLYESVEQEFVTKSGEKKVVNSVVTTIENEGEILFVLTLYDITKERTQQWRIFDKEEFMRAFFEESEVAEVILESQTNEITEINKAALNVFRLKSTELVQNKPFSLLISPTSEVKIDEITNNIYDNDVEAIMLRADDDEWIAQIHSTKFQLNGKIFIRLSLTDITEIRNSAMQLANSNDHLQAIFKAIPDEIYIIDNQGYILDYTKKGIIIEKQHLLVGLHLSNILNQANEALIMLGIQNAIKEDRTEIINYQTTEEEVIHFCEARISKMSSDSVLMIVRDTTDVTKLESSLHHSDKLLKMIFHLATSFINQPLDKSNQEIVKVLSQIGEFIGVDRIFVLSFDWGQKNITQTHSWCSENSLVKNLDVAAEDFNKWINVCKDGRMIVVRDFQHEINSNNPLYQMMKDDKIQSFMTIPLMENGFCIGAVVLDTITTKKDFSSSEISFLQIFAEVITSLWIKEKTDNILKNSQTALKERNSQLLVLNDQLKKQNEEIIAKNVELDNQRKKVDQSDKLKTVFLNNVSHEIRTPLNGIVGFSQLLLESNVSADDKNDYAIALRSSVDRLTETINDIMDVSLLISGNMPIHIESIPLMEVFDETYNKYQNSAQVKHIDFVKDIPAHLKSLVFDCDKGFVKKLVNEITANAIKYTKKGSVTIGFSLENSTLCLFAKDTGTGISDEILPHISEPFIQQDSSTTRRQEGAGLGLTIVYGIVKILNGKVDIQTEVDKGTNISIYIPSNSVIQQVEEKKIIPTQTASSNSEWPTVLVAEDEDLNVLYVKRIFKAKNFNVIYARNGKEAVDAVEASPNIDIILMDIKMPIMNGLEATEIIKKTHPKIKIIAVTAYSANDDRITCLNAGCDDYVSKPFRPTAIFELMDKWLVKE